jgi:nuclear protein localization family protein 4
MIRIIASRESTFEDLGRRIIDKLPSNVDPTTITIANSPNATERDGIRLLSEIAQYRLSEVELQHGDLIFIGYQHR